MADLFVISWQIYASSAPCAFREERLEVERPGNEVAWASPINQSKTLFNFELVDSKIANISEENKSIRFKGTASRTAIVQDRIFYVGLKFLLTGHI